jgi:tripartite-type tricarboxylate transporter receptor subunit TctC
MKQWFTAALAALTLTAAFGAAAQYPDKPIKLIVPFPPGGGTDIIGRLVGDKLSSSLGWKVVVENKPGAGGTLGMDAAAKSRPDGYTMVLGQTSNMSIAPSLMPALPYDPVKAFTPVTLVDEAPLAITVGANSPIKTLADLIAAAKAQPGKLLFASPGNATVAHLTGELFQKTAGALEGSSQRPDGRRVRLQGLHRRHLVRHCRARRHAGADRAEAEHGDHKGPPGSRCSRAAGRRSADRTAGVRRRHQGRRREVEQGRQGSRHQDRVVPSPDRSAT